MNIVVRDLFGDSSGGLLAVGTVDGSHALGRGRSRVLASHGI